MLWYPNSMVPSINLGNSDNQMFMSVCLSAKMLCFETQKMKKSVMEVHII